MKKKSGCLKSYKAISKLQKTESTNNKANTNYKKTILHKEKTIGESMIGKDKFRCTISAQELRESSESIRNSFNSNQTCVNSIGLCRSAREDKSQKHTSKII